jgi:hypothetical protein
MKLLVTFPALFVSALISPGRGTLRVWQRELGLLFDNAAVACEIQHEPSLGRFVQLAHNALRDSH